MAIIERRLVPGDALPTVRALAVGLGVSPATVQAAYRILRQRGLVIANGRRGTRVAPRPAVGRGSPPQPNPRPASLPPPSPDPTSPPPPNRHPASRPPPNRHPTSRDFRDLTIGLADPALLPLVAPAVHRVDLERVLAGAGLDSIEQTLFDVGTRWFAGDGIPVDRLTVTAGALDAIERILQAHLRPGDRVILEDPAYPPIRDIVLALGLVEVPVAVDDSGLRPDALAAAFAGGAEAVVVIPRAQNPFGSALDPPRAAELAGVLEDHPSALVIVDDHASGVSGAPFVMPIDPARPRWAVVRTTSKILHPDLRLALLAGDGTTVARVEGRLALGPRWISHMLQATAAQLLGGRGFPAVIDRAARRYADRRHALQAALAEHGIPSHGRSGLNVWVPVREEVGVIRALEDAGWLALAGERFRIRTPPAVRITVATLQPDEPAAIAQVIATAERSGRGRPAY